jgi:hypothetical protein
MPRLDRSELGMVGYSVKNRSFKAVFFDRFIAFSQSCLQRSIVLIIDEPYALNDAAQRDSGRPTDLEIARSQSVGDERASMVRHVIRRHRNKAVNVEVMRWRDLTESSDASVIVNLRRELRRGIARSPELREELMSEAVHRVKNLGQVPNEYFLNFMIEEIPVLAFVYYAHGYLIDVYPGPNFAIFRQLEAGRWASILPIATKLTMGKNLSFIETTQA